MSMDTHLPLSAAKGGFTAGFLVGGLLGQGESLERFQNYSAGKSFGNARNALRRKLDFGLLMFIKNGLRGGLRMGFIGGISLLCVTQLTTYRNKYASWTLPTVFGTVSASSMVRGGTFGILYGFGFGFFSGAVISSTVIAYALYRGSSINDAYWELKHLYEEDISESKEHERKVERLMKDENIFFRFFAELRLRELESEKEKEKLVIEMGLDEDDEDC